jgi:acetyl-CoA acetyltransferase
MIANNRIAVGEASIIVAGGVESISLTQSNLNLNGGAVPLGHPYGMSGIRYVGSTILELGRRYKEARDHRRLDRRWHRHGGAVRAGLTVSGLQATDFRSRRFVPRDCHVERVIVCSL